MLGRRQEEWPGGDILARASLLWWRLCYPDLHGREELAVKTQGPVFLAEGSAGL